MVTEQQIQALVLRFARIFPRITAATLDMDDATLRTATEGEWSIHDVLDHLRGSYAIISYRIYTVLIRDNPPMPAIDERQWALVDYYSTLDVQYSMATFSRMRIELLVMLQTLTPADWERTIQHETNGTMSLWTMMEHLVSHEEEHCEQIEKMVVGD